jgi:hypothetical protein
LIIVQAIQQLVKRGAQEVEDRWAEMRNASKRDEQGILAQLQMQLGSEGTCWEELYDAKVGYSVLVHRDTGQRLPADTAICHVCDGLLERQDRECFKCSAPRNLRNARLYRPV